MEIFTRRVKGRNSVVGAVILKRFYEQTADLQKTKVTVLPKQAQSPLIYLNPENGLAMVAVMMVAMMMSMLAEIISAIAGIHHLGPIESGCRVRLCP